MYTCSRASHYFYWICISYISCKSPTVFFSCLVLWEDSLSFTQLQMFTTACCGGVILINAANLNDAVMPGDLQTWAMMDLGSWNTVPLLITGCIFINLVEKLIKFVFGHYVCVSSQSSRACLYKQVGKKSNLTFLSFLETFDLSSQTLLQF